jgi:quinol monooxygenase YgiN
MTNVFLTGQLVCSDQEQKAVVEQHLALHIALTRSEPGCISFEVSPTQDPLIWQVDEQFQDAESFRAHQQRVAESEWGMATANIDRHYEINGM